MLAVYYAIMAQVPRIPAYNKIHECIGADVCTVLPAYVDIHGTVFHPTYILQAHLHDSMCPLLPF